VRPSGLVARAIAASYFCIRSTTLGFVALGARHHVHVVYLAPVLEVKQRVEAGAVVRCARRRTTTRRPANAASTACRPMTASSRTTIKRFIPKPPVGRNIRSLATAGPLQRACAGQDRHAQGREATRPRAAAT
jgi:hypothetical protein